MGDPPELSFWGDALVRWPGEIVAQLGLSAADAAYLKEVGLPAGGDWTLRPNLPARGARLASVDGLPVLAYDEVLPICIDREDGGRLLAMATPFLVNSSVRQFGLFLMSYQDYRLCVGEDETEAQRLIHEIERAMRSVDAVAMVDREAYWPQIFEQMRDGLL